MPLPIGSIGLLRASLPPGHHPTEATLCNLKWRRYKAVATRNSRVPTACRGFHQDRLTIKSDEGAKQKLDLNLTIREAEEDAELQAASHLRAISFYAYPPERAFAGKIHQQQVCAEEFELLKEQRERRRSNLDQCEKSATILAVCPACEIPGMPEALIFASHKPPEAGGTLALLGCLDVHAVRALPGEVLIGNSNHAAYMANVCVAVAARRQGVGKALLQRVRELCRQWDGLYVHTQAVNEVARAFYAQQSFVLEQEESSNEAHYRGKCLDGIEGRGRSVLLKDMML